MPEYLSPGVYVEETSFRSKAIEAVSTTTTGLIGPTRFGPVDLENVLITSLGEFERIYGDGQPLVFTDSSSATLQIPNFMWHAARAFFFEGGQRLYVSRVFRYALTATDGGSPTRVEARASAAFPGTPSGETPLTIFARYPGLAGRMRVQITVRVGQNVLRFEGSKGIVGSVGNGEVVLIKPPTGTGNHFYLAKWDVASQNWIFTQPGSADRPLSGIAVADKLEIRVVTLTVTVIPVDPGLPAQSWAGLAPDPSHVASGINDSFTGVFGTDPHNREFGRELPILFDQGSVDGLGLIADIIRAGAALKAINAALPDLSATIENPKSTDADRTIQLLLAGGGDAQRPLAADYEGLADFDTRIKTGLTQFEDIEDISIVAAPGSTYLLEGGYRDDANAIMHSLIAHAQRMRYRIAVLDSGNGQTMNQVRALRAQLDSSYAALYYPWVRVLDPISGVPMYLPPSGFVAGIYARNDVTRAVYKAPANEVVNLSQGFEILLNKAQQDVLNPEGINCFRFFEGRGYRLWGARTVSSDTEWNYVNLRRYFAYLERSIDRGTQWAVFEPNGDQLWANVRRTIEEFLLNEWQSGALLGQRPEQAFFVKCDRTTMTQSDLDNGRLVCLIGVAALRPAEFVIFRIGQWTGDRVA